MTEAEDRLAKMLFGWGERKNEEPKGRTCCRKHWEEDNNRHAVGIGDVLWNPIGMPFIVCQVCGNKRCPKATDCSLECTGSNDSGQPGSIY
jgi:hypothetical protein